MPICAFTICAMDVLVSFTFTPAAGGRLVGSVAALAWVPV